MTNNTSSGDFYQNGSNSSNTSDNAIANTNVNNGSNSSNTSDNAIANTNVNDSQIITKNIQQQITEELYSGKYKYFDGILYRKVDYYYDPSEDETELSRIALHIAKFKFKREDKQGEIVITQPYATAEWAKKCLDYAKLIVTTSVVTDDSNLYCTNGVLVETIEGSKVPYTLKYKLREYNDQDFCIGKPKVSYAPQADTEHLTQLYKCLDKDQRDVFNSILCLSLFGGALQAKSKLGRLTRAVIVKGQGNNGKDAFKMPLVLILGGDRTSSIKTQAIAEYDSGANRFGLSPLLHSRLNWSSENPEWVNITNLNALKEMVTSDPLTIEEKHKKAKRFQTNCINVFSINKLPRLDTAEESIKSRFCVILFKKVFTTVTQEVNESKGIYKADPRFQDEQFLINNVCSAFLNDLIAYRQKVYREGVIDWTPTLKAIEDIQREGLHLREFCYQVGLIEGDGITSIKDIYAALDNFYLSEGCYEIEKIKDKSKKIWQDSPNKHDPYIKGSNQVYPRLKALFPQCSKILCGTGNSFGIKGLIFQGEKQTQTPQITKGTKVIIYPDPTSKKYSFLGTVERIDGNQYMVLLDGRKVVYQYLIENLEVV